MPAFIWTKSLTGGPTWDFSSTSSIHPFPQGCNSHLFLSLPHSELFSFSLLSLSQPPRQKRQNSRHFLVDNSERSSEHSSCNIAPPSSQHACIRPSFLPSTPISLITSTFSFPFSSSLTQPHQITSFSSKCNHPPWKPVSALAEQQLAVCEGWWMTTALKCMSPFIRFSTQLKLTTWLSDKSSGRFDRFPSLLVFSYQGFRQHWREANTRRNFGILARDMDQATSARAALSQRPPSDLGRVLWCRFNDLLCDLFCPRGHQMSVP